MFLVIVTSAIGLTIKSIQTQRASEWFYKISQTPLAGDSGLYWLRHTFENRNMSETSIEPAGCCNVEIEIAISASKERVWKAIFEEIEHWWLPDFLMLGAESKISFDPQAGGRGLLEESADGNGLQWYGVQMILPQQFKIHLVGHIAPEWGGPSTSSLKLAVEESTEGCVLKIADARHGLVNKQQMQTCADGWQQLFSDGLKTYVEANAS